MGTREWYHYAFFNNYTRAESDILFDKIAVPESRKIAFDSLLKPFASVDFSKPHQPLLFIGGANDNIFSAEFTQKIAGRYSHKGSRTDYKRFEGRSHFICGEKGWEEVAGYIQQWLQGLK